MSRIGLRPILIPSGVTVSQEGLKFKIKGPKGHLEKTFLDCLDYTVEQNQILVARRNEEKFSKSYHGTVRQLLNNMIEGVEKGFVKRLQLVGIGYKALADGKGLTLNLGYSHPIKIEEVKGITFTLEKDNVIIVSGIDKELVGIVAANIKSKRVPDAYKGKGVRYEGEKIKLKEGKKS